MRPIIFSLLVSILFLAGCKKEELNSNSDKEKQKIYFLKVGNTWVYKNAVSTDVIIDGVYSTKKMTTYDTMYVSRKILNDDGKDLYEVKLKRSYVYNGVISYDESVFGEYVSINDLLHNTLGNYELWRGIPIKNEAIISGKKSGGSGGCDFFTYGNSIVADSIKFDYFGKSIDAYLSVFESYCEGGPIASERVFYHYADGIGLLKVEGSLPFSGGVTSKELIYFSELQ
jgi:hypothetical protein